VSGKDSLNNEYRSPERRITIPHTLLVSALGIIPDVRQAVTMDLKAAGNVIYLVGMTRRELGGSHLHLVQGQEGGTPPRPDLTMAPTIFAAIHQAIQRGLVRSCHDLSEGGLAVALAEMAFAGELGVNVPTLDAMPVDSELTELERLFSESATRFVLEVEPHAVGELESLLRAVPFASLGMTTRKPTLRIGQVIDAPLHALKESWQTPQGW
jgi:phosphoribosylformylglycinamidine synthase